MVCSCFPSPRRFWNFFFDHSYEQRLNWSKEYQPLTFCGVSCSEKAFVSKVSVVQTPNFSWGIIRIKAEPNYLDRLN